jgi:hypothetical protein
MLRSLLLGAALAALASGCTTMTPKNPYGADVARVTYASCVKSTGSRIVRRDRECLGVPGAAYSRSDLQGTGAFATADALGALDPAIRTR